MKKRRKCKENGDNKMRRNKCDQLGVKRNLTIGRKKKGEGKKEKKRRGKIQRKLNCGQLGRINKTER